MIIITYKTHQHGALCLGTIFIAPFIKYYILSLDFIPLIISSYLFYISLDAASSFPDIDCTNSYISRKYPSISLFFRNKNIKHREITHSTFAILTILLLFICINLILKIFVLSCYYYIHTYLIAIQFGILIGYLSHILLDMLNPSGVCLLYPLEKRYNLHILKKINLKSSQEYDLKILLDSITILLILLYTFIILYSEIDIISTIKAFL